MHYASIKRFDIANGEGVRVSLFVSGCPHHCKNCFNKEAWDSNYGEVFTEKEEEDILEFLDNDFINGLSLLGGEPMWPDNQKGLIPLLKKAKERHPEKKIWCYTGYLFDKDILDNMNSGKFAAGDFRGGNALGISTETPTDTSDYFIKNLLFPYNISIYKCFSSH